MCVYIQQKKEYGVFFIAFFPCIHEEKKGDCGRSLGLQINYQTIEGIEHTQQSTWRVHERSLCKDGRRLDSRLLPA